MTIKTFLFNKIGRDKTYEKIVKDALHVVARELQGDERIDQFKCKLQEETSEVVTATSPEELIEELADVLEVIHGFAKALNIKFERIEKKRIEKRNDKGGFDRCIFIEQVTCDENYPVYDYLMANPDKFPRIEND